MTQNLSGTPLYPFCADYSAIATCLFAIQDAEAAGTLNNDSTAQEMLRIFDQDSLRKLYLRTLLILRNISGGTAILPGDFDPVDFLEKDFDSNESADGQTSIFQNVLENDVFFQQAYFSAFLDTRNSGYSSRFQTILNIFAEFCSRSSEISNVENMALSNALVLVLEAFDDIQQYLISAGLNPCNSVDNYLNNSSSLYLQAAGSDGAGGIPEGIHLRWSLAGNIGSNHLLKGDYDSASGFGYNQPNDYIQVSRTPYANAVRTVIDFDKDVPVIDQMNKTWNYIITQDINGQTVYNRIRLSFTDADLYNQLAAIIDPQSNVLGFLSRYTGIILLEIKNKSLYMAGFDFQKDAGSGIAVLKIETESVIENTSDAAGGTIYSRKTMLLDDVSGADESISAENIWKIRLKKSANGYLQRFYFETYHDFLITRTETAWSPVGDRGFSLSLIDSEVFDRLETSAYPVDQVWPQFNEGTTVKVANYRDKWLTSRPDEPSIKEIVTRYLDLSDTDSRAEDIFKQEDAGPGDPGFIVSYLDVLHMLAIDYHIARMLGMAHIDVFSGGAVTDKFIYRVTYSNRVSMGSEQRAIYTYMSLPTSKLDKLIPEKPAINPISYTAPADDEIGNNTFDGDGYAKTDDLRFINISRAPFSDEIPGYDFFADIASVDNHNVFITPKPVFYGIEYRPANQSKYVKPEITAAPANMGTVYHAYDIDYPQTGIPETVPVPDNVTSLYHHLERQEGVHFYAIYGISWFARASALSEEAATNATHFTPKNRLLPPSDVAVQYIQKENTLLFTTATEQAWYQGRSLAFPGQDTGLTRVTFNWVDIIDITQLQGSSVQELATVVRPDKIDVFFGLQMPSEITGLIRYIQPVSGAALQLSLFTAGYQQIDGTTISPVIAQGDFSRFTDSLLTTPEGKFRVIRVDPGTDGPIITIEKAAIHQNTESEDVANYYGLQTSYLSPGINSRFSMVENLNNTANWKPVNADIALTSLTDINNPVIETSVDTAGNISKYWIGGINANAIITPLFSQIGSDDDMPGYYKVEFGTGVTLATNPQFNLPFDPQNPLLNPPGQLNKAHVEWYKGNIRIPFGTGGAAKKTIEVMRIEQSDTLILYVYDPEYLDTPIMTSSVSTPTVAVNFHPGYRAYLFAEPASASVFNQSNILPTGADNSRKTLIGLQTVGTKINESWFRSGVSIPAVMLARKMETPVQPDAPITARSGVSSQQPNFAKTSGTSILKTNAFARSFATVMEAPTIVGLKVRPDATSKAAFTFDIRISAGTDGLPRSPFGFVFFRTSQDDILNALYNSTTITQIKASLAGPDTDAYYDQRFWELASLVFNPGNPGQFNVLGVEPHVYGFPAPDKTGLVIDSDSIPVKTAKYRAAIESTFLPLTQQTPINAFIKEGLQTENKEPKIRDINGNMLDPSNPDFDPFPMIRKYSTEAEPGTTFIRFTDYSLRASSDKLYFYAGAEVTSQLVRGTLSVFTEPVYTLQSLPPETPLIRTFTVGNAVSAGTPPLFIDFQLSPFSPEDRISLIRIYRTNDMSKAGALQTMDSHVDIPVNGISTTGYQIRDTLSDIVPFPAGETFYYRLAAVRIINNEFDLAEEIISAGSAITAVKIIDTVNPPAPNIIYHPESNSLSWTATTNNGIYYLYRQNKSGNWEKISTIQPGSQVIDVTYPFSAPLSFIDTDGNAIYPRFKVKVENASGLLNLTDKELTIKPVNIN
ncbi:hypothetical protein [Mucilaginibacter aquaedulcis]|uniref:hypothetical protein n=1 Tax=Mucilaginibacter aquaedulcis TaxID=1187081 RepID=UPI0025B499FF|nr:hypothetical protein [Mucilaginibacter aquaedulcis]MDN3548770.1 hypothetical protein [Mucilaginibacter aquaedulcis]